MSWILLLCATWSLISLGSTQKGYSYDKPSRPFSASQPQPNFQNQPSSGTSQPQQFQSNNFPPSNQNEPSSNGYPSRSNGLDQQNYPNQQNNNTTQTNGYRLTTAKPRPFQRPSQTQQPDNGIQSPTQQQNQPQNGGSRLQTQSPNTNGFTPNNQTPNRFVSNEQGYPSGKPNGSPKQNGLPQNGLSKNDQTKPQKSGYPNSNQNQNQDSDSPNKTYQEPSTPSRSFANDQTRNQNNGFSTKLPGSQRPQNQYQNNLGAEQPGSQRPQNQYKNNQRNQGSQEPQTQLTGDDSENSENIPSDVPLNSRNSQAPSSVKELTNEDEFESSYAAIPGEPDTDYPIYSEIPETAFKCDEQQYPGYYADVEARCQVFHICTLNQMYNFLCPNGTIFHQEYLVCVWWNQFDCNSAPSLYGVNAYIYGSNGTENRFNQEQQRGSGLNQGSSAKEVENGSSEDSGFEQNDSRGSRISGKNQVQPTNGYSTSRAQQPADTTQPELQQTERNGYSGTNGLQFPNRAQTPTTNGFEANNYSTSKSRPNTPNKAQPTASTGYLDSSSQQFSNRASSNELQSSNGFSPSRPQQTSPNAYSTSRNDPTGNAPQLFNRQNPTPRAGFSQTTPNLPTTYQKYQPQTPNLSSGQGYPARFGQNQGQTATVHPELQTEQTPEDERQTSPQGSSFNTPESRFSPNRDNSKPQLTNGKTQLSNFNTRQPLTPNSAVANSDDEGYRYNQPDFGFNGNNFQKPSRGYLPPLMG